MTAKQLLDLLLRRGAKVELLADRRLRITAQRGVLTPDVRAAILELRGEMIGLLTTHACTDCGRFAFAVPTSCFWCRRAAAPNN